MSFTRNDVKKIREELQKELENFAKTHNVTIKVGNATYDDTDIHFKLDVASAADDTERLRWEQNCRYVGLVPEDYGMEITLQGQNFIAVGVNPKARKNCIIVRRVSDGKEFLTTRETFIRKGGTDAYSRIIVTEEEPPTFERG